MTSTYAPSAITGKQMSFLNSLLEEADRLLGRKVGLTGKAEPEAQWAIRHMMLEMDSMTKVEASKAIGTAMDNNAILRGEINELEEALEIPPVEEPEQTPEYVTEVGMYRVGDQIFKVLPSRSSDRHYAKELVGFHWEDRLPFADVEGVNLKFRYAKGAMRMIRPEHRMTSEQERAFGQLVGSCIDCGKLLTDRRSIDYGKGPVCSDNYTK